MEAYIKHVSEYAKNTAKFTPLCTGNAQRVEVSGHTGMMNHELGRISLDPDSAFSSQKTTEMETAIDTYLAFAYISGAN
eukprot:15356009-Ditylum_brightwellii.AAC.1